MRSEGGVSTKRKRKLGKDNRGGDLHLAPTPLEKKHVEEFGSSSDSGQGVRTSMLSEQVASNLAQSVVALAPEAGSMHNPACTGLVFEHSESRTYIMVSLSLFRPSDGGDDRETGFKKKTKVRLPNNKVLTGILVFYDLKHNLGVVNILQKKVGCLRATCLDPHQQQPESHGQVVSVRRCFISGKLMACTRTLAGDPMGAYCEEAAACGILADFLGNIAGLNCYADEGTTFIPRSTMLDFLVEFKKACVEQKAKCVERRRGLAARWLFPVEEYKLNDTSVELKTVTPSHMSCLEGSSRMQSKQSACHYCDPEGLSAPGERFKRLFPGPSWPSIGDDAGMRLLCKFEDEFDEDMWSKLTEEVASDMSQSVVALASFSGDKRFFACTGIFIGCNELTTRVLTSASLVRNSDDEAKVADNLKIEVCLPDNEHATGTLQHYNLRYNIAIITILGSRCTRTVHIYDELQTEPSGEVVAVGRVYESGKLIATAGTLIDKPSELDCKELKMSTCKITKAGIGGPLIDYGGSFIGMDFYGTEETPYLPRNVVLEVLRSFDAKPDATDLINDHIPNRWPVPKPSWCYPTWHIYMGDGVDECQLSLPRYLST